MIIELLKNIILVLLCLTWPITIFLVINISAFIDWTHNEDATFKDLFTNYIFK